MTEMIRPRRAVRNSTTPGRAAKIVSSRPIPAPSPGRKRVPRWRTMISPPRTVCPANTFTPRRLDSESRPLRLEPSPFLCAIAALFRFGGFFLRRFARGQFHVGDLQARQLLAVSGAALVAALGLELQHAQLRPPLVADHLGLDFHFRELFGLVDHVVVVPEQQRLERDLASLARAQPLDHQGLARLDAVLLAACL